MVTPARAIRDRVLATAGNPHVARLLGSYEARWDGQPYALGMVAEFEVSMNRERTREGVARAKAEGKYRGREPKLSPADAKRLRTSFIDYEIIAGGHPLSAPELLDQPVRQPVVVLLGPDEVTFPPDAVARCRLAYPDLIGPFLVPDSGHFMQWEQPATVTSALRGFLGHGGLR